MFNMVETKVTRIGGTLFARIPADEAKRLGLHENSPIDIQVKPLGRSVEDVLALKGRFKGMFAKAGEDLWRDP